MSLNALVSLDLITNSFASNKSSTESKSYYNILSQQLSEITNYKPTRNLRDKIKKKIIERGLATKLVKGETVINKRVGSCGTPLGNKHVNLEKDNNKKVKLKNILCCNSIAQCPECRYKIIGHRKNYIKKLNEQFFKKYKGSILLVTLTCSHNSYDSLEDLLGSSKGKTGILGASAKLNEHDRLSKIFTERNVIAVCRTYDISWSKRNGWNPHIHLLIYIDDHINTFQIKEAESKLNTEWVKITKSCGLKSGNAKHSVKITPGENAVDYFLKCGSARDYYKESENDSYTIFQLERFLVEPELLPLPQHQVEALLKKYYQCFFGKRLVTWSRLKKLKNRLDKNITENSENNVEHTDKTIVAIDTPTWRQIKYHNLEIAVINAFELYKFDDFILFLKDTLNIDISRIIILNHDSKLNNTT